MAKKDIESQIHERIEAFVDDISELVRASALDAVRQALGGVSEAAPPRPRRGRPPGAGRTTRARSSSGKRLRRTAAEVEQVGTAVLAHVRANPAQRLGDIAKALRMETKDIRRPTFVLVEEGKLRTEGQRGGTRYFTSSGRAPSKGKTRKKAKKKTRTKKRKAKRA